MEEGTVAILRSEAHVVQFIGVVRYRQDREIECTPQRLARTILKGCCWKGTIAFRRMQQHEAAACVEVHCVAVLIGQQPDPALLEVQRLDVRAFEAAVVEAFDPFHGPIGCAGLQFKVDLPAILSDTPQMLPAGDDEIV